MNPLNSIVSVLGLKGRCVAKIVISSFSIIIVMVASGCVSANAAREIKAFSDATALTADNAAEAFRIVDRNHFDEEVSVAVLHFDDTNNPGFNPSIIRPFMGTNALQVRLDILGGLKSYAADLSSFLGNAPLTNLDASTTKFGLALMAVNSSLVQDSFFQKTPVNSQELEIFTSAINTLGHWLIAHKRQQGARQAIESMQQPVAAVCRLLQKDFEILGQQAANDCSQTLKNENQYILDHLEQFNNNPDEKREAIREMAALTREMRSEAVMFDAMKSSTARLEAAHKSLGEVFSKNTTNISALINELTAESQRIRAYYQSLDFAN